jgi:hypothetical protein
VTVDAVSRVWLQCREFFIGRNNFWRWFVTVKGIELSGDALTEAEAISEAQLAISNRTVLCEFHAAFGGTGKQAVFFAPVAMLRIVAETGCSPSRATVNVSKSQPKSGTSRLGDLAMYSCRYCSKRAWLTIKCGNSDSPSSVSCTRPVRVIFAGSSGDGADADYFFVSNWRMRHSFRAGTSSLEQTKSATALDLIAKQKRHQAVQEYTR